MHALLIKDLKFSYDKKNTIFSGLSFDVLEGEYVSFRVQRLDLGTIMMDNQAR